MTRLIFAPFTFTRRPPLFDAIAIIPRINNIYHICADVAAQPHSSMPRQRRSEAARAADDACRHARRYASAAMMSRYAITREDTSAAQIDMRGAAYSQYASSAARARRKKTDDARARYATRAFVDGDESVLLACCRHDGNFAARYSRGDETSKRRRRVARSLPPSPLAIRAPICAAYAL